MHDLLLALTFISMIVAPAIIAAKSGKKEFDPETESLSAAERQMASFSPAPLKRERNTRIPAAPKNHSEAATLPLHQTLGLAGR
jgi:hypothetical protein